MEENMTGNGAENGTNTETTPAYLQSHWRGSWGEALCDFVRPLYGIDEPGRCSERGSLWRGCRCPGEWPVQMSRCEYGKKYIAMPLAVAAFLLLFVLVSVGAIGWAMCQITDNSVINFLTVYTLFIVFTGMLCARHPWAMGPATTAAGVVEDVIVPIVSGIVVPCKVVIDTAVDCCMHVLSTAYGLLAGGAMWLFVMVRYAIACSSTLQDFIWWIHGLGERWRNLKARFCPTIEILP